MASLTVGDITLTGTATGFPSAPTILGTTPINVVTASGTSTVSLNANYSTTSHLHDGTYQPFGTYVTSVTGTSPITTSGTTAITVGIDQAAITGATAATNAEVVRFFVKNTTGTTIPKGSAVYVSGATGDNALISLASATSDPSSSKTLGLTAAAIDNDAFGYVIEAGYLTNIDTSATTAGAAVWLGNTPGSIVFVSPPAEPSHAVYLGVVVRVQAINGSILVKVQNGYELDELHDVSAASPSDADIIQYKTSSGLWTKSALVNSVTSTSTTSVPTANAVRIANNAATAAQSTADLKLAKAGDIITGTLSATGAGAIRIYTDAATSPAPLTVTVAGDTVNRYAVTAAGGLEFGSGSAVRDSGIYRSGAATLTTIGNFTVGTDLTVGSDITLTDRIKHASQLTFSVAATDAASVLSTGFYMPPGKTIRFEGTTDDGFETDLTVVNPTTDNTISLPNQSGTLAISEAGIVQIWLGGTTSVPTGWLLCNGAAVSRTTYADLFTAIGTNFGAGDGSTTFNIPDLDGHLLVGSEVTPGTSNQAGTTDSYLNASWVHTHSHNHVTNPAATTSGTNSASTGMASGVNAVASNGHTHSTDIAATTSDTDASNSSGITVKRTRVNYIIKW